MSRLTTVNSNYFEASNLNGTVVMMFNKKPAWLRAGLKVNRFKIPHSTCTNR